MIGSRPVSFGANFNVRPSLHAPCLTRHTPRLSGIGSGRRQAVTHGRS
jgi:hypothetical protein